MVEKRVMNEILKIRSEWKKGDDQRDAGLPLEVPGVTRINNLAYGPDPKWHLLDIYRPQNVTGKFRQLLVFMEADGAMVPRKLTNSMAWV